MRSLGGFLRERRESRGLSLEELSRATRVAPRYLEALEADNVQALPPPVFARGFVRVCCQVLQAPVEEALALYHQQTGTAPPVVEGGAVRPVEPETRSRGTVLVSFVLLVVLGAALFAVTLALQSSRDRATEGWVRTGDGESAPSAPAPSAAVDALDPVTVAPAPTTELPPAPAPAAVASTRTVAAPPPSAEGTAVVGRVSSPYRLIARVSEPTWIRVRMDDGRATEETIPAGAVREWVSNAPFVLTVGNAGGVALELNGLPLPPLGERGAVISRLVIPPPSQ